MWYLLTKLLWKNYNLEEKKIAAGTFVYKNLYICRYKVTHFFILEQFNEFSRLDFKG